ncbi:MAG: hypothetical protein LC793_17895 [Thermomicrobia bacterium]|nr:hypothetical protein [Thermomicrobia bacterium]
MVRERAEVVIIGAGVMGASLAFHLTRLGLRDILRSSSSGGRSSVATVGTTAAA